MSQSSTYTARDILEQIDSTWRSSMVSFDGGKQVPADARVTIYRDDSRWAIVLEQLASTSSSPGHWGLLTALYKYGNCVSGKQGWENSDTVKVTSDGPEAPVFMGTLGEDVNPECRSIRIRDQVVPIDLSLGALRSKGIPLPKAGEFKYVSAEGQLVTEAYPARLGGEHVLFALLPENRDLLLATEVEKRRRLPGDIPKFMQLEEWNHPLILTHRLQYSDSETFQLLAEAIATGDPSKYRPTLPPNTHWKNWLEFDRI